MTEVAIRQTSSELAISAEQLDWTPQQLSTLQHLGVEGASEGDLRVYFHQAKRTGLDPFAKQIYMIGRLDSVQDERGNWVKVKKFTIQTGIDGYRLVARRAAKREGEKLRLAEPLWCGTDMQWLEAWPFDEPPVAAKVVVYRDGEPFAGVAMYREFVQTKRDGKPNSMWARMPANQLAKCAEAQALRKAYPQDLAGIYVDEEMGQADRAADGAHVVTSVPSRRVTAAEITGEPVAEEQPAPPSVPSGPPATSQQVRALNAGLTAIGYNTRPKVYAVLTRELGREITSSNDVTKDEASRLLDRLARGEVAPPPPPNDDPTSDTYVPEPPADWQPEDDHR